MAPHDYRRLLLAHRDASPAHVPGFATGAPSRTPGLAGPAQAAPAQPGPRFAPEPGAAPVLRAPASRAIV